MSGNDPSLSVWVSHSIFLLATLLCMPSNAAWAAERTVCGVRDGTAGDASLTGPDGREVIELARQGGDQRLLDEADRAVGVQPRGERGTQNGVRYCLRVRFDSRSRPLAVLAGRQAGYRNGTAGTGLQKTAGDK